MDACKGVFILAHDYGDYGWLEYDDAQEVWYIEQGDDDWVELPEKYVSDRLWHFENAYEQ